jgi:PAS domain S-box-containing protein
MADQDEEKQEWFELMCRSSPDFMVIVDRERRFRWVNRLFPGLTHDDVIGKSLDDYEDPDTHERSRAAVRRAFETDSPQDFESHATMPDGSDRWYQVRCIPLSDHPDRLLLVTTDITERKLAELERDAYQQQLYHSQKIEALGRLAGGVAHDFNNLLTPIIGYAQSVAASLDDDHPAQDSLRGVCEAAMRAGELTNQLLTIQSGRAQAPEVIDLTDVVRGMERMLARVVPENIRVDATDVSEDAIVWADRGQLEQVLLNLVLNACDAMPEGGDLQISTGVEDQSATLIVRDTGVGMADETLARVFEPFFTTKGPKGTGLGLATAHGIVEQIGGRFEVTSEPGVGTMFRVVLPLSDEAPKPRVVPSSTRDSSVTFPTTTVLVVEDAHMVRRMVVDQLETAGLTVLEAPTGEDAITLAAETPPGSLGLVLTDVVMPEMNGPQVVQGVRKHHPTAKTIFMSGHPRNLLSDLSGTRLLRKPFTRKQLLDEVRRALEADDPVSPD